MLSIVKLLDYFFYKVDIGHVFILNLHETGDHTHQQDEHFESTMYIVGFAAVAQNNLGDESRWVFEICTNQGQEEQAFVSNGGNS